MDDNFLNQSSEDILDQLLAADSTIDEAEELSAEDIHGIKLEFLKERLESEKQDRNQRKDFAGKIFGAVMVYLFMTILILLACGNYNLHLSDTVLVALLTTASANVIGILMAVVRYLFHHK